MAYNVSNEYNEVIYSEDAKHKLKLLFNGVEYTDSNIKTEYVKVKSNILSSGEERFSLDNFVSKEAEIVIHDIDLEDIVAPISISIGTLVDENNDTYEYVPIGIFNIDETPTTDNGVTTIKLKDNAVKFDFPYDGSGVIEEHDGEATMLQILQDICEKAGVDLETTDFINKDTKVSVWDNSINARVYVMYISEKAGCIATISRDGKLQLINLQRGDLLETTINTQSTLENVLEIDKIQELKGNTQQDGTPTPDSPVEIQSVTGLQNINVCGKNLFDTSNAESRTHNGITFTLNNDGSITANGTATSLAFMLVLSQAQSSLYKAGNYAFSLVNEMPNNCYVRFEFFDSNNTMILRKDITKNGTATLLQNCYLKVSYVIASGTVLNNFVNYIQIEQGSTATEYEPYKGNTYEVNLGKNLFDKTNITAGKRLYYWQGAAELIDDVNYCVSDYIKIKPNTTYTINLTMSAYTRMIFFNNNKNPLSANETNATFTTPNNTAYVRLSVPLNQLDTTQLEKGSTATSYSPYFTPIELNKIGTYQDRIYKDNGKWYLEKNTRKLELAIADMNNNENFPGWNNQTQLKNDWPNINTQYLYNTGFKYLSSISVQPSSGYDTLGMNTASGSGAIYLNKNYFSLTQTQWKEQYPNLVVTIMYALATPEYTEITNEELINQLESIRLLKGTNNINVTSEDLEAIVDVSYYEEKQPIELNPLLMESYKEGEKLQISRVVYEDAIRKFEYGNEDNGTLYINSSNPYITNTTEILNIYNSINGFNIYSMNISKILGNPAIDPWDIIQFTYNNKTYKTLGQNTLTYNGVMLQQFDTQIGTNAKTQENVTLNTPESKFRKVSTEINQLDGTIKMIAGEVGQYDNRITKVEQDVNEIKQTAISYEDLIRNKQQVRMLHIENAFPNYPLKLSIKNASLVFPSNNLYPSNTLYTKDSYLIVDKTEQLSENAKMYHLPLTKLYVKDGVYDEFVVEKKNMYVIHRIGVNNDNTTYILDNEVIEDLGTIDIELFKGDNYIYLYSFQNDGVIYEITYTIPSEFTNVFATEVYVDSSIEQTANQILLQVNEKVDENEIIAKLNVAVEDGQGIVNLTGNTVTIDSDNFKLDAEGKINATAGDIGGFQLTKENFNNNISGIFDYTNADCNAVKIYIQDYLTKTQNIINLFDFDDSDTLTARDYSRMRSTLQGTSDYHKQIQGKFSINSNDPKNCLQLVNSSGKIITSLGLSGIQTELLTSEGIVVADPDDYVTAGDTPGVYIDKTGKIKATGTVTCNSVVQTSLEKNKKNIEKYKNKALDTIKNIDIYKYNLNEENDDDKKHIGFIIGEKYNYSQEITSMDNKGVDNYSFTSLLCKAIQEQQEQIEELQKEIKLLKEEK